MQLLHYCFQQLHVKRRIVKCSVLPVLATEQPPYDITQSSCLVEHIIRLCHQLQQNVCIRGTAVLGEDLPR